MSSVDLHTHLPFQLLIPEAIAIVCAPSKIPSHGIFRITDPPGMDIVMKCNSKETFHYHEKESQLYREISPPSCSHVRIENTIGLKVIDLR